MFFDCVFNPTESLSLSLLVIFVYFLCWLFCFFYKSRFLISLEHAIISLFVLLCDKLTKFQL